MIMEVKRSKKIMVQIYTKENKFWKNLNIRQYPPNDADFAPAVFMKSCIS